MIKVSNREANNMSDRNYKVKGKKLLPKWYNKQRNDTRKLRKKLWSMINNREAD